MQNIKYKYHPQRMVGQPTSIPFSGDVPLSLRETPIPTCSILTEAKLNANIQKIRKNTTAVSTKLTNYINNSETFDFNRKPKEILQDVYKLFSLRGHQTKYAQYQRKDGSIMEFRLGLHDANGNNFNGVNINISVYISYTYRSYRGLSTTPYEEYEIKPQTFEENPKMVVDSLVNGVLSAINSKPFELDPNVATSIDTTKTDTIEDIINRYKNRTYKFSDGTKTYGLNIDAVVSCTINQIKMNLKDRTNTIYSLLIESNDNKTYLLSANDKILIKPTKDDKEKWAEIIHCLFKYAYNSAANNNKQDTNMKTENRKRNVVRLTESQLKQMIAESVKNVLNEIGDAENKQEYYKSEKWNRIVDRALKRFRNDVNPKRIFDEFNGYKDDYAVIRLEYVYNYLDLEGNLLSPNQWFDFCDNFEDGYGVVKLNGKWNFIDGEYGEFLFPNQWFDFCDDFNDGYADVKLNKKWFTIDKEGNLYNYETKEPLGINVNDMSKGA